MTTYQQIDKILAKRGWTVDRLDMSFRYKSNSRLVDFERVMRAMPDDITDDLVAAFAEERAVKRGPVKKAKG